MHYDDPCHQKYHHQPSYFHLTSLLTCSHIYKRESVWQGFIFTKYFPPQQIKHAHFCICGVYLWSHLLASVSDPDFSTNKQDICAPLMWTQCQGAHMHQFAHRSNGATEENYCFVWKEASNKQTEFVCHLVRSLEKLWIQRIYRWGGGGLLAGVLTSGLLPTSNHKQRKWEKEVNRQRPERSFLASSSQATSLSSWLFIQTKAADNAGAAVLTAWSRAAMKRPRGWWMGC